MKTQRDEWKTGQPTLDSTKYVFLDETWASTAMTRAHGRAPRGQRLVLDVPHGHWKTTTFVAALRFDGLNAPTVVDGAMTGDIFVAFSTANAPAARHRRQGWNTPRFSNASCAA